MERKSEKEIRLFNDGHTSFFTGNRICYPENEQEEQIWLKGYYQAIREHEIGLEDLGQDTFLWAYRKG